MLLFGGVALHRPDLVALGAPLLRWLLVHLAGPGGGRVRVRLRGAASTLLEDQGTDARVWVSAPSVTELFTVSYASGEWLGSPDPGTQSSARTPTARRRSSSG